MAPRAERVISFINFFSFRLREITLFFNIEDYDSFPLERHYPSWWEYFSEFWRMQNNILLFH